MRRQLIVSAKTNAKYMEVENKLLANLDGTAHPADVSHRIKVNQEDFIRSILPKNNTFGFLPPGVRWISPDGHSLIVQEDPGYKTIEFRQGGQGQFTAPKKTFRLPHPYLVYGISPDPSLNPFVSHLYVRTAGLENRRSYLQWAPFPNIFKNGAICTHVLTHNNNDRSYHGMVALAIDEFWSSLFNSDVNDYMSNPIYGFFHSEACKAYNAEEPFKYWSTLSIDDMMGLEYHSGTDVGWLMSELLKVNHVYSMGSTNSGRLMSLLVSKSLEKSIE